MFTSPSPWAPNVGEASETLGADIGSAQRDAYFYANFWNS